MVEVSNGEGFRTVTVEGRRMLAKEKKDRVNILQSILRPVSRRYDLFSSTLDIIECFGICKWTPKRIVLSLDLMWDNTDQDNRTN